MNIHERCIPLPPSQVGVLIDSLASEHDRLWPCTLWPAMRFDRPLGVGATGGHGPIRYSVEDYRPGEHVRFRFIAPRGFNGHHWLDVQPLGGTGALLRHTLDMNAEGPALLSWPLVFRWLHDACVEDALAVAQNSLGIEPEVRPWSPWVRFLRRIMGGSKARPQRLPGRRPSADADDSRAAPGPSA